MIKAVLGIATAMAAVAVVSVTAKADKPALPLMQEVGGARGRVTAFSDATRLMVPTVVADFVECYLHDRLHSDPNAAETKRRMDFDEVVCSFPLTPSSVTSLKDANGLSVFFEKGRKYGITWYAGEKEVGSMTFPASYNLIMFTDLQESSANLVARLKRLAAENAGAEVTTIGIAPEKVANPFMRRGAEFQLGHLAAHTYLDSVSGRPLWTAEYPSESLANAFVSPRAVAEVLADVEMKTFDGSTTIPAMPLHLLNDFFAIEGCTPYFGVADIDKATGKVEALVSLHNPELAYMHKLEVEADPAELWPANGKAKVKIVFTPFIKLHNLTNLWGDRK